MRRTISMRGLFCVSIALYAYTGPSAAYVPGTGLVIENAQSYTDSAIRQNNYEGVAKDSSFKHEPINALDEALAALATMQDKFFEPWRGEWPKAIDWTGAVMNTYLSAMLITLTRTISKLNDQDNPSAAIPARLATENLINRYFAQSIAYYFSEDAAAIRFQAYDDMLWVVLGWLESIKFIDLHDSLHYNFSTNHGSTPSPSSAGNKLQAYTWHGRQFRPAFAHRAHIFYDLVSRGWDERLCGGGLTWNPALEPYKNAITNELYISASVAMYLYHPGDDNSSPFLPSVAGTITSPESFSDRADMPPSFVRSIPQAKPHDKKYLQNAIRAYDWLAGVNMRNAQGLYVDGYHIHNVHRGGTKCTDRNEMVYSYNQGVLLSAQRLLWEATGDGRYLNDGHDLIENVIAATGFHDLDDAGMLKRDLPAPWRGLGARGILTDFCDPDGSCVQDAQTFKGIFFHHFTAFCRALAEKTNSSSSNDDDTRVGESQLQHEATAREAAEHALKCRSYTPWVELNARAALLSRDDKGLFGMWWGAASKSSNSGSKSDGFDMETPSLPQGAVDVYSMAFATELEQAQERSARQTNMNVGSKAKQDGKVSDPNKRGRGRTVETQGGGVMVLRALHELRARFGT